MIVSPPRVGVRSRAAGARRAAAPERLSAGARAPRPRQRAPTTRRRPELRVELTARRRDAPGAARAARRGRRHQGAGGPSVGWTGASPPRPDRRGGGRRRRLRPLGGLVGAARGRRDGERLDHEVRARLDRVERRPPVLPHGAGPQSFATGSARLVALGVRRGRLDEPARRGPGDRAVRRPAIPLPPDRRRARGRDGLARGRDDPGRRRGELHLHRRPRPGARDDDRRDAHGPDRRPGGVARPGVRASTRPSPRPPRRSRQYYAAHVSRTTRCA